MQWLKILRFTNTGPYKYVTNYRTELNGNLNNKIAWGYKIYSLYVLCVDIKSAIGGVGADIPYNFADSTWTKKTRCLLIRHMTNAQN